MPLAALSNWPWLHWQQQRPRAQAIDAGERSVSWQQLHSEVAQLAGGFRRQGVRPGARVLMRSGNSLQALLCWLALLGCGAQVLVLNPQLPHGQLAPLLPTLAADFMLNLDADLNGAIPALQRVHASPLPLVAWSPAGPATLTLTSGSSGLPKAVVHSAGAHLHSAQAVIGLMGFNAQERWLLSLPLFHVSGLGIIWRWLACGATLVLADRHGFHAALARSSFASLVPTQLWRLLRQPVLPHSLRTVLLGGAAIDPELVQRAEAAGIRCFYGYGMTETASTVCARRADARPGVGQPLAGQQVRLVAGEVWLRSATLAQGYWREGRLQPLTDSDGWFASGDLGEWRQGGLCILGRRDNLFFCGGEAVQPEAIERLLLGHPQVSQVLVVPLADAEYGERPVALVAGEVGLEQLAKWACPQLMPWQRPVRWLPLPALIAGGIKLPRQQLKQWAALHC